jgi:hypothetical protein
MHSRSRAGGRLTSARAVRDHDDSGDSSLPPRGRAKAGGGRKAPPASARSSRSATAWRYEAWGRGSGKGLCSILGNSHLRW